MSTSAQDSLRMFYFWKWNYSVRNPDLFTLLCEIPRLRDSLRSSFPPAAKFGLKAVFYTDAQWKRLMDGNAAAGKETLPRRTPTDAERKIAEAIRDKEDIVYEKYGYSPSYDLRDTYVYLPLQDGFDVPADLPAPYHNGVGRYGPSVGSAESGRICLPGLRVDSPENKADTIRRLRRVADMLERTSGMEEIIAKMRGESLDIRLNAGSQAVRLAGLWLHDRTRELGNGRGTARRAIRELTALDDFPMLGMENAEDADLRFSLRRTRECIAACDVLPFTKKGTRRGGPIPGTRG